MRRLHALTNRSGTFAERLKSFLNDRYGASHLLLPILNCDEDAFFTNGDDELLQRTWARENGLGSKVSLERILLAQIESHRTEVFYNQDPIRYTSEFVRKLPGCVRRVITWWAAPSRKTDLSAYDLIVCNFPSILDGYRAKGWKAAYFSPAHDPAMDQYAANEDRPIDVLFVGGYSRYHLRRAAILEDVAKLRHKHKVVFCLDRSRFTVLAESPIGRWLALAKYRRPDNIRAVSAEPVFGRDLYQILSMAKIVLNGAVDMAGNDRGNMRCFEALGCAALMVSDKGNYPDGMDDGRTMLLYGNATEARVSINTALREPAYAREIAVRGYEMIRDRYNKQRQWDEFCTLIAAL
jgi:hypothetical protein